MSARRARSQPRYLEIAKVLLADLAEGRYPVGALFPEEVDLCARFNVSRLTVRSALSDLEDSGLLKRQKARGAIVTATEPRASYVQSLSGIEELLQYPTETQLTLVEQDECVAGAALAAAFGIAEGDRLLRFGALRTLTGADVKLCWSDIFVIPELGDLAARIGRDTRPIYRVIEEGFGMRASTVRLNVEACAIDNAMAWRPGVAFGTPGLRTTRTYSSYSGVFERSVSVHPAGRFTYSLTFDQTGHGAD